GVAHRGALPALAGHHASQVAAGRSSPGRHRPGFQRAQPVPRRYPSGHAPTL
ncbi:MAG: hypothetical protein AVDCRST_MAG76-3143, partial [uncultured Acidimicrobiales bacterium]